MAQPQPQLLLDFDWKLKYAVSSDSLAYVKQPLLRLELCLSRSPIKLEAGTSNMSLPGHTKGEEKEPLFVASEYSKSDLDSLIASLESANQVDHNSINMSTPNVPPIHEVEEELYAQLHHELETIDKHVTRAYQRV